MAGLLVKRHLTPDRLIALPRCFIRSSCRHYTGLLGADEFGSDADRALIAGL